MMLNNCLPVNSGHAILICVRGCIICEYVSVNVDWLAVSVIFLEFTVIFNAFGRFLMLLSLMLSRQGGLGDMDDGQWDEGVLLSI